MFAGRLGKSDMKRVADREALVQRLRRKACATVRRRKRKRRGQIKARRSLESVPGECLVDVPPVVGLEGDGHDALIALLAKLRAALSEGKALCLNFRRTETMIAGGTLLLFSELNRLKAIFPSMVIRCIPPRSDKVAQVLQHLGLFALMNYQSSVVPTRPDVVNWRKASSSKVDGQSVGTVLGTYQSLQRAQAQQLFRGASEAMMNAMNHAYTAPRNDGLESPPEEKWWLFCREDDESIFVGVCDLGIGIPRSLPAKYANELVHAAMSSLSNGKYKTDARLIQAAMEIERTRTDKRGRGKGLSDLKRIVDEVPGGLLYIFSNKGMLKYDGTSYKRTNFSRSIKGTVVLWKIPLGSQNVHVRH